MELQQFLTYFEQTTADNACNRDLAELHEMVSRVRTDEEVELEYMKIFEREAMIREEGREEGQTEGSMLRLIQQIIKKAAKGKSLDLIAEELEEDTVSIAPVYDLVIQNPGRTATELLPYVCSVKSSDLVLNQEVQPDTKQV